MIKEDKENEKLWAVAAHISAFVGIILPFGNILGPGAIFAMKKNKSKFINNHAKEALNFQISLSLYIVAVLGLSFFLIIISIVFLQITELATAIVIILWVLTALLLLASFTLTIISAAKAYQGKSCRYPFTIRFIKK